MSGLRERMNRLRGSGGVSPGSGKEAAEAGRETAAVAGDASDVEHEAAASDDGNRESGEAVVADAAAALRTPLMDEAGERLHPAWSSFGVALRQTDKGEFLLRQSRFPLSHRHGTHALGELLEAAGGLHKFHPDRGAVDAKRILYLDLETTGLGVGAGNVPFMVGLAYLDEAECVVEQYLIRHPAEEYAMLHALLGKLPRFTHLVTYNGKTFDWPLVRNRMIMNGIGGHGREPVHLDFLHPSRSIWRNTLASLKLSHVEEERLGIHRSGDVPGSLAPEIYFRYLADGSPEPLEGVFVHNESDLLSLLCLSIRFGHLLNGDIFERIPYPEEAEELVRTGLWLEKMDMPEHAEPLFRLAAHHADVQPAALIRLAERDKKAGNWERAVLLWQKVVIGSERAYGAPFQEACTQLAMYYEHKVKDCGQALHYALQALAGAEQSPPLRRREAGRRAELDAVRNRVARLRRKLPIHPRLEYDE